jgi:hypothetical protein
MPIGSPQAAHRAAASILSESRFHSPPVPNPLHGALVWVGRALADPFNALGRGVASIGASFPGGVAGAWAAGGVLLIAAIALLAARRTRTRLGREAPQAQRNMRITPAQLERDAAVAERAGHWDAAVRLRFRAGLLRLGERLELASTDTIPNHAIGNAVHSARFDALAARFDEVAYGGQQATAADAESQRREWPELLVDAGRR